MPMTSILKISLGLALVAGPVAALAGPGEDITVFAVRKVGDHFLVDVPYRDLDLARPGNVQVLRARVETAAHQGCSPALYDPPLTDNERRGCVEDAVGGAAIPLKRAERRAMEIARNGHSSIPPLAIAVRAGF